MERLFGMSRLGIVINEVATAGQVISIIKKLAKLNNLKEIKELIIKNAMILLNIKYHIKLNDNIVEQFNILDIKK